MIKNKENKNNIKGILFPDKIIPVKKIINNIGIKNLINFLKLVLKKIGIKKKENIENL